MSSSTPANTRNLVAACSAITVFGFAFGEVIAGRTPVQVNNTRITRRIVVSFGKIN